MDQANNLVGAMPCYYPTTIWSEVGRAGETDSPERLDALDRLLRRYLRPLEVHLRYKFLLQEPEAADLLHEFVGSKIILGELLARASRNRGRFRTFLLHALDNFVVSRLRRENAHRRRPENGFVSWDEMVENGGGDPLRAPSERFDLEWTREVISEALRRMEAECRLKDCLDRWKVFQARVLAAHLDGEEKEPYESLVRRLNFESTTKAQNTLVTAQRQFARLLREVVSEYAGPGADAEEELRELMRAVATQG